MIDCCLPRSQSFSDIDPSTFFYFAPVDNFQDEHEIGFLTREDIQKFLKKIIRETITVHGVNAPVLFTFFGWCKLAVQPREMLLEHNLKTPLFQITGDNGTGKSDICQVMRCFLPQLVTGDPTQSPLDPSPSYSVWLAKVSTRH